MIKRLTITLAAMIMCLYASAQGFGGPQYPSPIVHPDNTVTFNLNAPQAKNVKISAQFAPKADMQRLDNGVWTITLGPVTPDIYPYCFEVDGIAVMAHELRSVPHGKVDYVNYYSETMGVYGNAIVYTPPTYDKNPDKKYPVFYLISGTTDTEEVYFKVGRMNLILDNLIAEERPRR